MAIEDDVRSLLENYTPNISERIDLSNALEIYHSLVERNIITPRGNQLLNDTPLFQNSNFSKI